MTTFRYTFPEHYPPDTAGWLDTGAREGHYTNVDSVSDIRVKVFHYDGQVVDLEQAGRYLGRYVVRGQLLVQLPPAPTTIACGVAVEARDGVDHFRTEQRIMDLFRVGAKLEKNVDKFADYVHRLVNGTSRNE